MPKRLAWRTLLAGVLLSPSVPAQELPGDRPIRNYLAARVREMERDLLPHVKTRSDFDRMLPSLRAEYLDMLGLDPLPARSALEAAVTGKREGPSFTVEMVHFQSRPGLYVTGNLYLPRPLNGRYPTILYFSSHMPHGRDGNKTEHVDQGIWYATHGYVAFILDTLELGEIPSVHRGTLRQSRWWWHSAGYTPAGVEYWNAVRALDYLSSRTEVDPDRIGVTGISGGGAVSFWIAAGDDRVKAAAPVSGMGDLGFYVGEDGVNVHCDCVVPYNVPRWNWTAIAALAAPRPLLFVNSDQDVYFPMAANERVFNRLEKFYARLGAGDRVQAVVSVGGHAYRTDIRRAVAEFFNRTLKGDARPVQDADAGLLPARDLDRRELRVFPADSDLPRNAQNARIDEIFVPSAVLDLPSAEGLGPWREALLGRLRARCFGAWPDRDPSGEPARLGDQPTEGEEETEPGLTIHWQWLPGKAKTRWVIVLGPEEISGSPPPWTREVVQDGSALLVSTRGIGQGAWTRKTPPNTIERAMTLLGATVDGGRVWDMISVVRRRSADGPWQVAGRGNFGIIGAYAALYEPALEGVTVVDPPVSHHPEPGDGRDGPAFLGVLRVLDIPEALGCLAPRRLVLANAPRNAFHRTADLYRLAGTPERLVRN
jgi:dienelactone hydrolase